jgi:hypothetical protein
VEIDVARTHLGLIARPLLSDGNDFWKAIATSTPFYKPTEVLGQLGLNGWFTAFDIGGISCFPLY